jgi:hypothetical protein
MIFIILQDFYATIIHIKTSKLNLFEVFISDREGIRTPNPQSRNLIFYPVELHSHIAIKNINSLNFSSLK